MNVFNSLENMTELKGKNRTFIYFLATLTFVTLPMNQILSPILELVLGPSPPILPEPKLDIYPLFGPMAMCFFSKTHAPFTIVLNKNANTARTFDNGSLVLISKQIVNFRHKCPLITLLTFVPFYSL